MKIISNNTVKDILELKEVFDSSKEIHFETAAELIFRLANEIKNSNEVYYKLVQWPESQFLMEHPRFTATHTVAARVLTFKSEELRNEFLDNFKDLIETAKSLL